jgi:circadian clock protein KaiB
MRKHESIQGKDQIVLKLFVAGMTGRSMEAITNIKHFCEECIDGPYDLEIIDLYKNPEAAAEEQIIFSPSLIKQFPLPRRILIGNLSNSDKIKKSLGINAA